MNTVHLARLDPNTVLAVKAVRAARRHMGDVAGSTLTSSMKVVQIAKENHGVALVGECEGLLTAREAADIISELSECEAVVNATPAMLRHIREANAPKADVRAPTPEEQLAADSASEDESVDAEAYATALVLMSLSEGNPLRAAAAAHNLGRASDQEVYADVIRVLVDAFPWIVDVLVQSNIINIQE
jgi:hypothetical protein